MRGTFLSIILFYQIIVSSSQNAAPHLCRNDQNLALLRFKQTMTIDASVSTECESNGQSSYPKTESWNSKKDCCTWDGIKCNELTGQVIGLDLSCSHLQGGVIDSNSSIFQLSKLESINLAYNDFSSSNISHRFGELASLTYFNISNSEFSGQFPPEFLHLSNLVLLDISFNSDTIQIDPMIFRLLLQNLTQLSEVSLSGINISSAIPNNLSASIEILNLGSTSLLGTLPGEIFQLPNLQSLKLFSNPELTGELPNIRWKSNNSLTYLDLSGSGLSGEVPDTIGSLGLLNYLDLSSCKFRDALPVSLWNLTKLDQLILYDNDFTGEVPSSALANLQQLIRLDFSSNNLQGEIPNMFENFIMLEDLDFSHNFFTGQFPSSLINLTQLQSLALSNNSLTGPIPPVISGYPNLVLLFLNDNSFNETVPQWVFSLPSLKFLELQSNQLTGQMYDFQSLSLMKIRLRENQLHGPLTNSISKLENLTDLDVSLNKLSGEVDLSIFSTMSQLEFLDISYNNLSLTNNVLDASWPAFLNTLFIAACHVKNLDLLRSASNLVKLDLSHMMLHEELPKWMDHRWSERMFYLNLSHNYLTNVSNLPFQNLVYLDLSDNLLQGQIYIPPVSIQIFFTSNNNLSGKIPSSICTLNRLTVLDLSNNSFSGMIPPCLRNVSSALTVLDMHANHFQGEIPSIFGTGSVLTSLNLRGNQLEGTVPRSISKCTQLEVLDLGNNNLNGTFPRWLGHLPKLKVLSLRSNNMRGVVTTPSETGTSFSALRILDLSGNHFTGNLSGTFFKNLTGMMQNTDKRPVEYMGSAFYQDSVEIIVKGQQILLVRILTIFITIDISSNRFKGVIPDEIGVLISLRGLNLSHNAIEGQIPFSIANLNSLESLDLSSNQLVGEIPQQLTNLTYLAILNLSQNHLIGPIPLRNQFTTFGNKSYMGNSGLCGFPLSIRCGDNTVTPVEVSSSGGEEDDGGFIDGFTWEAVMIGYGSGLVVGLVITCSMFMSRRPVGFNKMVDRQIYQLTSGRQRREINWLHQSIAAMKRHPSHTHVQSRYSSITVLRATVAATVETLV